MRKFNITVNGNTYEVDVEEVGGGQTAAPAAPVSAAPKAAPAPAPAAAPKAAPVAGAKTVTAPMPGTIMSLKVKVGDSVKADDVVCILEAMKMENEIFAGVDGKIAGISVSEGASVNTGDVLVSIA